MAQNLGQKFSIKFASHVFAAAHVFPDALDRRRLHQLRLTDAHWRLVRHWRSTADHTASGCNCCTFPDWRQRFWKPDKNHNLVKLSILLFGISFCQKGFALSIIVENTYQVLFLLPAEDCWACWSCKIVLNWCVKSWFLHSVSTRANLVCASSSSSSRIRWLADSNSLSPGFDGSWSSCCCSSLKNVKSQNFPIRQCL